MENGAALSLENLRAVAEALRISIGKLVDADASIAAAPEATQNAVALADSLARLLDPSEMDALFTKAAGKEVVTPKPEVTRSPSTDQLDTSHSDKYRWGSYNPPSYGQVFKSRGLGDVVIGIKKEVDTKGAIVFEVKVNHTVEAKAAEVAALALKRLAKLAKHSIVSHRRMLTYRGVQDDHQRPRF
jgi:hypothetical protein